MVLSYELFCVAAAPPRNRSDGSEPGCARSCTDQYARRQRGLQTRCGLLALGPFAGFD